MRDKYSFPAKFFLWLILLSSPLILGPLGFLVIIFGAFEVHSKVKCD